MARIIEAPSQIPPLISRHVDQRLVVDQFVATGTVKRQATEEVSVFVVERCLDLSLVEDLVGRQVHERVAEARVAHKIGLQQILQVTYQTLYVGDPIAFITR